MEPMWLTIPDEFSTDGPRKSWAHHYPWHGSDGSHLRTGFVRDSSRMCLGMWPLMWTANSLLPSKHSVALFEIHVSNWNETNGSSCEISIHIHLFRATENWKFSIHSPCYLCGISLACTWCHSLDWQCLSEPIIPTKAQNKYSFSSN